MTSIGEWLAECDEHITRDCALLLTHKLGVSQAHILTHPDAQIPAPALDELNTLKAALADNTPLAYLLEEWEFWSLTLMVSPAVLVPRPETELLVELSIELAPPGARFLDMGTGSGAIAVAVAKERPDLEVTATDRHADALAIARANADKHGTPMKFTKSDWFAELEGVWEIIVSNPPYIAEADPHLPALKHEPLHALASGQNGLDDLARIVANAPNHLTDGGQLLVEHGFDQAEAVRDLMTKQGFTDVHSVKDLAQIERVTSGTYPHPGRHD